MVLKRRFWIIGLLIAVAIAVFCFFINSGLIGRQDSYENGFEVKQLLLRENILVGGGGSSIITIKNLEKDSQTFKIGLFNLEGIASVEESQFVVGSGEEKKVAILFKDIKNKVDVYVGNIVIEGNKAVKKIPVVVGVEKESPSFTIIQEPMPAYGEVYPGGKLGMEIKIFNLKDYEEHKVKINYFLKDFNGNVLMPDEENRVVGERTSITKIINLPEDIGYGKYVFVTLIDNENIGSYIFDITKEDKEVFDTTEYLVLIVLVFVIGVFLIIFYFFRERDKFLIELNKQQNREVRENLSVLRKYKKEINKIRDIEEKKQKLRALEKNRKEILAKIKRKQKIQKNELSKLIRENKLKEAKRKLDLWKKEGYNFSEIHRGLKGLSKTDILNKMRQWKRQGYKF